MARKLRAGVIGVGHIGRNHARIYAESALCELSAVMDTNADAAADIAAQFNTVAATSLDDFLSRVDAVSLATPTPFHHEIGCKVLAAGKHLLIEKPITETIEEARELADMASAHGLVLQVGHVERFNPVLEELEKRLSRPIFIEAHRLSPYPHRSTDIGVVLDLMIHDIEIVLHLVKSPVKSMDVVGIPVLSKGEDIANARLRFESGCVANITASRISPERMRKIRVFQSDAYLSLDYGEQSGVIFRKEGGKILREEVAIEKGEPLRRELESFLECAAVGARPMVSGHEATAALELSLEITRRIHDSKPDFVV